MTENVTYARSQMGKVLKSGWLGTLVAHMGQEVGWLWPTRFCQL